jgi:hypothetical protein
MNDVSSKPRLLNQSAVKEHALRCSRERRAGKFKRVGQDFYSEMDAEIEALIRELRNKYVSDVFQPVHPDPEMVFVTGTCLEKVREELDAAVARLIQRKLERQPSVGVTIGATR